MQDNVSLFLGAFPKIYCLSLTSSTERRVYMERFIAQHQLNNLKFIDAATPESDDVTKLYEDSKVHTFPSCFRCGNLECGDSTCNNTLIPVQVATFASYIRVLRAFLASGEQYALFIEDDIKLTEHANVLCQQAISNGWVSESKLQHSEPALVQFGWALCDDHKINKQPSLSDFLGKMSNPAFALNKAMAEEILARFEKVDTTADIFIHRICANATNAKTFYPPLFYEMSWSTGEVESTIHPKPIRLSYLETHNGKPEEIENATTALTQHKKHTDVYPLLIIGHPRCGSGYSASLCQAIGLKIGHEKLEDDGICSWMFATDDDCPWALNDGARTRRFKYFKDIVMHVRNPRSAIASIMRDNEHSAASYNFRKKHIFNHFNVDLDKYDDNFTRAVASYVYWNKLVLLQNPSCVFRVEDEGEKLVNFLRVSGSIGELGEIEYPSNDVNANKKYQGKTVEKPDVDLAAFTLLPDSLLKELNALCHKFGYEEFNAMKEFDKQDFLKKVERQTLEPMGWIRSAKEEISVDNEGRPTPWWTIPAIEFMNSVVSKHWRVFEYGCGHSTLWWQEKVNQVIGVDHDAEWVDRVRPKLNKENSALLKQKGDRASHVAEKISETYFNRWHKTDFGYDDEKVTRRGLNDKDFIDYADAINEVGGKFDCIVIDGMARRLCAYFAVRKLTDDGFIVFDNSNRSDYMEGYQFLVESGFYQIRFSGPVAGAPFPSCTSIFVKSLNSFPKVVFEPSMFNIPEY